MIFCRISGKVLLLPGADDTGPERSQRVIACHFVVGLVCAS